MGKDIVLAVIGPLGIVIHYILEAYIYVLLFRAILSWVSPDPYNPIVRALYSVTEPVLSYLRRKLPLFAGSIDFSPMVAMLVVWFIQMVLDRIFGRIPVWIGTAGI